MSRGCYNIRPILVFAALDLVVLFGAVRRSYSHSHHLTSRVRGYLHEVFVLVPFGIWGSQHSYQNKGQDIPLAMLISGPRVRSSLVSATTPFNHGLRAL